MARCVPLVDVVLLHDCGMLVSQKEVRGKALSGGRRKMLWRVVSIDTVEAQLDGTTDGNKR